MAKRSLYAATAGCFFSYFLFGFVDNMKGAAMPGLLAETGFTSALGGTIVMGEYAGFVIATLLTGIASDMFGKKPVMLAAGLFLLAGVAGFASSGTFASLALFFALVGVGCGSLELGGSNMIVSLHGNNKGRFLNLLSSCHGVGSMTSPLLVGVLMDSGRSWRHAYALALIPAALFVLYFFTLKIPGPETGRAERIDARRLGKTLLDGKMACLYLVFFAYVAAEIGLSTWLPDFLQKEKGISPMTSSVYLSVYFGCIMAGRLAGSAIVDKVGHVRIMTYSAAAAILCIVAGVFCPPGLAILLPLAGLFFAVIFPTATAVVSELHSGSPGTMLGIMFCCGGIGGMFGPWIMGILIDAAGFKAAMSVNAVFCLAVIAGLVLLRRRTA